jgi:hypothetical protein
MSEKGRGVEKCLWASLAVASENTISLGITEELDAIQGL